MDRVDFRAPRDADDVVDVEVSLQRLAAQLVEELEYESHQLASPELRPGAASVTMAVEALITIIYTLDVRGADEQGRVLQALRDEGIAAMPLLVPIVPPDAVN